MTEPRDYEAFLRAKPSGRLGDVLALLPEPPSRATLLTQSSRLVGSALLPVGLWVWGSLDALDVLLLYFAEGASYGLMVAARILFTAALGDSRGRPRAMTALIYLFWHSVIWIVLVVLTLAAVAPNARDLPLTEWVGAILVRFRERSMWLPAAITAGALAQDAARRSDYIDAYLAAGPREVARYGYVYPMALTFLLATAGVLSVAVRAIGMEAGDELPLIAPAFFAAWLLGWSLVMQLLTLALPIWGRVIGRRVDAVVDSLQRSP